MKRVRVGNMEIWKYENITTNMGTIKSATFSILSLRLKRDNTRNELKPFI